MSARTKWTVKHPYICFYEETMCFQELLNMSSSMILILSMFLLKMNFWSVKHFMTILKVLTQRSLILHRISIRYFFSRATTYCRSKITGQSGAELWLSVLCIFIPCLFYFRMAFGNHFRTAQLRHTGKCNPSYASMAPVVRNLWSAYTVAVKEIYQKTGYYVYYQLYCVYNSWLSHPAVSWSWLWNWTSEISFLPYFHECRSIFGRRSSIRTSWLCIFLLFCSALE